MNKALTGSMGWEVRKASSSVRQACPADSACACTTRKGSVFEEKGTELEQESVPFLVVLPAARKA